MGGAADSAKISIHAPRGGSDIETYCYANNYTDFNPRSPWGERPPFVEFWEIWKLFQSTLPVGGATTSSISCFQIVVFQSTLPVGGATSGTWTFNK